MVCSMAATFSLIMDNDNMLILNLTDATVASLSILRQISFFGNHFENMVITNFPIYTKIAPILRPGSSNKISSFEVDRMSLCIIMQVWSIISLVAMETQGKKKIWILFSIVWPWITCSINNCKDYWIYHCDSERKFYGLSNDSLLFTLSAIFYKLWSPR